MELFKAYSSLNSTNDEARRLLSRGENLHGAAIFAHHQTKGRGQHGKAWVSQPGKHLAMSIILQPDSMPVSSLASLSMKICLAISNVLTQVLPSIPVSIKWPNDIYTGNKKLAGILIENSLNANAVQHCIIGIGMNVNETEFEPAIPNAISLFMISEKEYDILDLARMLQHEVTSMIDHPSQQWKKDYDELVFGLEEMHVFRKNENEFNAIVKGVDDDGRIILEGSNQVLNAYFSHEIKWKLEMAK